MGSKRTSVEAKPDRRIEYVPLAELKGAKRNPKKHADAEVQTSIGRFGYVEPMVLDERTGTLVAGHGRRDALAAMRTKGEAPPSGVREEGTEWFVPVLRGWASRSDTEAEAYLVASNQLTTLGGWDNGELGAMLKDLAAADAIDGIGFTNDDISAMLASTAVEKLPDGPMPGEDDVPEPVSEPYVKQGDLYALGQHRILCGDCRNFEDVKRLLGAEHINVAVTSPPYASQRAYDESSGFKPIPPDEYVEWYRDVSANVLSFLAEDGSYFVNIKEHCDEGQRSLYVKDLTIAHVRDWGWMFVDEFCWRNTKNGVPGGWNNRFKNAWEPVFHFARTSKLKFSPADVSTETDALFSYSPENPTSENGSGMLGSSKGREFGAGMARPSNVLEVAAVAEREHSAAYPVALPEFFIKAFSDAGDVVFDPFMGSGTTLIAAEKTQRRAFGTEISPRYTQVIIERWEKATGKKAEKVG